MTTNLTAYVETINAAMNSQDIESLLRLYSPECIADDVGHSSLVRGHAGLRTLLETYWRAFPDLRFAVTDTVIQDSRLVIVWLAEGTHQGLIMNIPPTRRRVQVRGVSVMDVEAGLITRGQSIWDLAGMLRHMGLLPEL
jgi:steroid delta-isomerase-like uncharacterized protein